MKSKISMIDCSPIVGPFEDVTDKDFDRVAEELGAAMSSLGICYLINHGIDMEKVETIHKKSKQFFELPTETKRNYRKRTPKKIFHGYSGPGDEILDEVQKNSTELREVWDCSKICWNEESTYPNDVVPGFKSAFDDILNELDNMAKKLLRCLERLFKLEDDSLIKRHRNVEDYSVKSQTVARAIYYYTLNQEENYAKDAIRCGEHYDWGSLTMLFQDMVGGLEVETLSGEWIEAVPVKNSILLNSGQLLEFYTAGQFRAAKHRVRMFTEDQQDVIIKEPRQSFIYFVNPDCDQDVFPLLKDITESEKYAKMPSVNANKYFLERMEEVGTY